MIPRVCYGFPMSRLKLRRFQAAEPQRLGFLLARAKNELCSEAEDAELLALLGRARRISLENLRRLAEVRGTKPVKPREWMGSQAKSS